MTPTNQEEKIMSEKNPVVIDTPEGIAMYRLIVLRGALHLELMGMRRRGQSAYAIIKNEFGLHGNKQSVYTQFCELIQKRKAEGGCHV